MGEGNNTTPQKGMRFFAVTNFKKFQHYKDRNPTWIKLYASILTDAKFNMLTDREQLALIKIWVLSSQNSNKLPFNSKLISSQICLKYAINLERFLGLDFIYLFEDTPRNASNKPLAPNKEKEKYKQEKEKPIDHFANDPVRGRFEKIWKDYPEKKGKDKAWIKYRNQVKTDQDWENIQKALINYKADMEGIRNNGHPDRAWQYGSTWFNNDWRDYVNYEPPGVKIVLAEETDEERLAREEQRCQANKQLDRDYGIA